MKDLVAARQTFAKEIISRGKFHRLDFCAPSPSCHANASLVKDPGASEVFCETIIKLQMRTQFTCIKTYWWP